MQLTLQHLKAVAGSGAPVANMCSILVALDKYGPALGLDRPHRIAQFVAQVAHESGRFRYDREVWGPTAAQKGYEDRGDLGHSKAVPGEAFLFRGRTGMQITGRANYRAFTKWARSIDAAAPDFEMNPDLLLTDPWEGLGPLWYWSIGNPEKKSLNRYADENDIEMITRRINGGLNGYDDRVGLYTRTGLVLLGYPMKAGVVKAFQRDAKLFADDIAGPKTRQAIHDRLAALEAPSLAA